MVYANDDESEGDDEAASDDEDEGECQDCGFRLDLSRPEDHKFCEGRVWWCRRCGYVVHTVREASEHMLEHDSDGVDSDKDNE